MMCRMSLLGVEVLVAILTVWWLVTYLMWTLLGLLTRHVVMFRPLVSLCRWPEPESAGELTISMRL